MAKRFTETTKWEDDWFVGLTPEHKLLWIYILDRCDHAGIWQLSLRVASRFIGGPEPDLTAVKAAFGDRVVEFKPGYWFIPKFITYQYGKGSSAQVFKSAIAILEKNGIDTKPYSTVSQELPNPYLGVKDKDKDKDKEEGLDFDKFWQAYPKKVSKGSALKAWLKHKPPLQACLDAIRWQKTVDPWTKGMVHDPATWLNASKWLDEPPREVTREQEKKQLKMAAGPQKDPLQEKVELLEGTKHLNMVEMLSKQIKERSALG